MPRTTSVKLAAKGVHVGSEQKKFVILTDFISGLMAGIEFHFGEALEEDDILAMTIDLFIIRFTFIITKGNRYDNL